MVIHMVIKHNMSALNTNRQLGIVSGAISSSAEKLSSGYRINRSADDAAGLSISEKMRKQIRGLDRAAENIEDGISYAQVADGALNEVHDILHRINELAVQSANGTNSDSDRAHINDEVSQLKTEMERIFMTTSFNERKIWQETMAIDRKLVGSVQVQAVTVNTPGSQPLTINNKNYGLLAAGGPYSYSLSSYYHTFRNNSSYYTINADASGVNVSWTAYNGTQYKTKTVVWNELRAKNFAFDIGDYFENKDAAGNEITDSDKQLLDDRGKAKFNLKVAFNCIPTASDSEIAAAINGTTMQQSLSSYATFEDENNTLRSGNFSSAGASFVYAAAYADAALAKQNSTQGYNFETLSDLFIEPDKTVTGGTGNMKNIPNNGATIATARNSNDKWQFSFKAAGLGNLTATSSQVTYYSTDTNVTPSPAVTPRSVNSVSWSGRDLDDQGTFWRPSYSLQWNSVTHTYDKHWGAASIPISVGNGTLGDVMNTLTGSKGLLSKTITNGSATGNKGATDSGGVVYITFDITSDNAYSYGGTTSHKVGTFAVSFRVSPTDTEQSILDRINATFNNNTVFDLNFNNSMSGSVSRSSYRQSFTSINDYEVSFHPEKINLQIHSGADTTDKIPMEYDCLRLKYLGMEDTNVLTQEASLAAIDEVSKALEIISSQRSLFGAYQNRMEHAYNIDQNSSENTSAAESQIRDTDMAEEMVRYSNNNILGQAGSSMLAQANQSKQGILNLIS